MVRSVNADGPKYIMGGSGLFEAVDGRLTAEEVVRREVEELHANPRFIDCALDSKTIKADEDVEVTLRKMARLHEGVAKRVCLLFLLGLHILIRPDFLEMSSELCYLESLAL